MTSFRCGDLCGRRRLGQVFLDNSQDPNLLINEMVGYAQKARKDGIISLDANSPISTIPSLKKSLMLAVDGTEPQEIRNIMTLELDNQSEHEDHLPRVFESAGGFAPTIGIIGAVLGLIQVMQHLDDISEVGRGIAVAFVATIYGVALRTFSAAGLWKNKTPHPARADSPRNDARRRYFHSGRNETRACCERHRRNLQLGLSHMRGSFLPEWK